jgi:IMP dehydrogenase/GMP reductase
MKKLPETLSYDDVTLAPNFSTLASRKEASTKFDIYDLPIMVSCMDTLGKDLMECVTRKNIPFIAHRAFKSAEEQFNYFIPDNEFKAPFHVYQNIWWAVGSVLKYRSWIDYLYNKGVRKFCVDMAHGDSQACIDTIKYIKNLDIEKRSEEETNPEKHLTSLGGPNVPLHIIAGNVATAEGFKRLQEAGADGIRVGIASGSICSTNIETAMGLPVLTSIIECMKVKKKETWLIADGGIRSAGDIAKAIYFGADFAMIGKLFAATDKACGNSYNINKELIEPGKEIYQQNLTVDDVCHAFILNGCSVNDFTPEFIQLMFNKYKVVYKGYHGMASRAARENILSYAAVEGVEGLIKYSGTTEEFITDTKLRLQASLSYAGARNWEEFRKNAKAYKRSISGVHAADVHMDILTKFH